MAFYCGILESNDKLAWVIFQLPPKADSLGIGDSTKYLHFCISEPQFTVNILDAPFLLNNPFKLP